MCSKSQDVLLLGMGNPLLDLQTNVDKAFLLKWGLEENNAILADAKHNKMFTELADNYKVDYIPGGATQNTLRVAQWILNRPNATSFFGSIGGDEFGRILTTKMHEVGLNVHYQVRPTEKTGTCAALIFKDNRSLVTILAAANSFTVEHLDNADNKLLINAAKCFYISGYFLTVCPQAMMEIGIEAANTNRLFTLNLSAPFICQFFKEPLMKVLPYVDILFGNETEAAEFAKNNGINAETVETIAFKISLLPKVNPLRQRMVVITQGSDSTIVVHEGKVYNYPVIKLSREEIVDTNGAGDAFVGGFLAQLVLDKPLPDCVKCGNYAASQVIQHQGCTFPKECGY